MAKILSKSNIVTGEAVEAWNVTQSIDAFTKVAAYDITVSGSFTLTGSLKVDGDITGSTTGTASFSLFSDYTEYAVSTDGASLADYNQTNYSTLQFFHPPLPSPSSSKTYRIGAGEALDFTSTAGVTLPINCHIISACVSVATEITGSSESGSFLLVSSSNAALYVFNSKPLYDTQFYSFSENIDVTASAGSTLLFRVTTPNWATKPSKVTHNITLNILPL